VQKRLKLKVHLRVVCTNDTKEQVFFIAKVFILYKTITLQSIVDEEPVYIDVIQFHHSDIHAKFVVIKTSGCEKLRVTVMLRELAHSTKPPHMIKN
jgi:hypothetical protein